MSAKLKAAILGFGGMGHCHASQYAAQKDVELVAVCDIDPAQLEKDNIDINLGNSGKTNTSKLRKYLSFKDMAKKETELDIIDICLPSDLHAEYSIKAMKAGFNVLCEKPMALNVRDCDRMIRVSNETGKFLMVAQCLRFAEDFMYIKSAYESGKYGKLLRLDMHRNGGFPGGWFRDVKRSGGALFDLHIHDLDFIQHMLGKPKSLISYGVVVESGGIDDSVTTYFYGDSVPLVTSAGSWTRSTFSASVAAVFEKGTLEIAGGKLVYYQMDKPVKEIKLPGKGNPYFNEIAYFADCVKRKRHPETATPESTRDTVAIIFKEQQSVKQKKKIVL